MRETPEAIFESIERGELIRLRASEARFRTIFENAPFMINSFAEDGTVLLWNQACAIQLGYGAEEVARLPDPLGVFYPEPAERDRVLAAIRGADGQFREYRVRHKTGHGRYQMWANFRLPDQSLISVGYDVTEMRQVQEQLRLAMLTLEAQVEQRTQERDQQRARLISSSKLAALGEMAGGIAHEINNPLAIISGLAHQLQATELSEHPQAALRADMLRDLRAAVVRISGIVSGMRKIARDASHDPKVPADAATIVRDTLSFCWERIRNFGVDLRTRGLEPGLALRCRPVEVSQVLLNLLNNAFDAVQSIEPRWVELELGTESDCVTFRVTDSGAGVPEELREKIFQPFFTTKPVGQGTGIGLSISNGIAEGHGGSLRYELREGRTSFMLRLPRA